MINKNHPLVKLFEMRIDNSKYLDRIERKLSSIRTCVKGIILYYPKKKKEDNDINLIKSFGNYHSINSGLRSKIINPQKNYDQKHMSGHDHVVAVAKSGPYVLNLAQKKEITLTNIDEKIKKELYYLLIAIKLTNLQHKLLNNEDYSCFEQLAQKHYRDLSSVLRFIKSQRDEIKASLDEGMHPIVFHKKFHSPEIIYCNKSSYKEKKDEISKEYKDQENPLIFYKKIFDDPLKYVDGCDVIQLEPSDPKDHQWNNNPKVKELIEEINKDLSLPNEYNNNLINNKKEEGVPLLV